MSNGDLISRKALIEELNKYIRTNRTEPVQLNALCADVCEVLRDNIVKVIPAVDAVELPCKIGDTVWCIRNFHGHKHPQEGIVSEMLFTKEMKLHIVVKYIGCGQWGEKIFLTLEEAEEAVKGEQHD